MKQKLLSSLTILLLVASYSYANQMNEVAIKLKESSAVVYTIFYDKSGEILAYKMATGYFIGEKDECLFVTALHAVHETDAPKESKSMSIFISYGLKVDEEFSLDKPQNFTEIFPSKTNKKYYTIDEDNDLVVFNLKDILKQKPLNSYEDYVQKTKDFPIVYDYIATMGHVGNSVYFNFSEGKILKIETPYFLSNFSNVSVSNSGGAIVTSDNVATGLLLVSNKDKDILQIGVSTTMIHPLILKIRAGLKGEEKSLKECKPDDKFKGQINEGKPNIQLPINK